MPVAQKLSEEMKAGGKLPSPTGVALRLIELTRDEDVSIDAIAKAMQADPVLSGRLIRFANMAFIGPRRPIVSVTDAVQRAGTNVVRQLVLGFSVLGHNRAGSCRNFDYSRFWARSLATAIAANALCLRVRAATAEDAFTCGLLADIGSLAFATLYPKEYSVALDALKLAIEVNPHLVISDWIMPELDGLMLCRALRETEPGRMMYFILLTGMVHDDELVEGFEAGVDDYVTKPFNPQVLTARLRAAERVIRMQEDTQRDSLNLRKFATELAVVNRRLQQAALTDALTGLPNRRHLMERLEQEWTIAARNQRTFSFMMIDIDGFKQVNDVHGHEVGDQMLSRVAALLRQAARVEDVVGRLGGDEFVVICPGANLAMAVRLAERLRQNLAQQFIQAGSVSLRVTVSIGVSQQDATTATAEEVMRRADAALYRAKRDGRNRVSGLPQSGSVSQAAK